MMQAAKVSDGLKATCCECGQVRAVYAGSYDEDEETGVRTWLSDATCAKCFAIAQAREWDLGSDL